MPDISIVVPVYEAEKFLDPCVKSVRSQTFQDWELLLIDDGSRDASGAICDRLAGEDSRIRVFHMGKNGGVSNARNRGLSEGKGSYLTFLDVDDSYEPRYLETLWSAREQSGADSAACAHLNVWPDGAKQPELTLPAGIYDQQEIREKLVNRLLGDRLRQPVFNGFIWRYLYSMEIIRSKQITFEGAYLEDELFLMEYFCNAEKLAVTEEPLYRYLNNSASATHRYMADFMQVFSRFMERKEALVNRYGLGNECPQWRENSNWAGLLIAIGNEYARGNDKSIGSRQKTVEELCKLPAFAQAIADVRPEGLSPSKQMVAELVRGRHFFLLTQMYRLKNHL